MKPVVEFYFDLGSPASYLAFTQLPGICQATDAELIYRPMLLGAVFQATGNASPVTVPHKGRYMLKDLARFAERYGVPMRFNPFFPINTLNMMRLVTAVQQQAPQQLVAVLETLFNGLWVEGLNLGDEGVLSERLNRAGIDAALWLPRTQAPEVKQALKDATEQAVARGVFGAPSCFVDGELYFGQDRLDFVEQALRRSAQAQ